MLATGMSKNIHNAHSTKSGVLPRYLVRIRVTRASYRETFREGYHRFRCPSLVRQPNSSGSSHKALDCIKLSLLLH
jgi:hypothetical protein